MAFVEAVLEAGLNLVSRELWRLLLISKEGVGRLVQRSRGRTEAPKILSRPWSSIEGLDFSSWSSLPSGGGGVGDMTWGVNLVNPNCWASAASL